jgi:hypothetical protein
MVRPVKVLNGYRFQGVQNDTEDMETSINDTVAYSKIEKEHQIELLYVLATRNNDFACDTMEKALIVSTRNACFLLVEC